jgi:hypothetical protein
MRIYLIFAFGFLLIAATAVGQDQSMAHTKEPSMEVATVRLRLGMPRSRVLAQIQQAGYKVLELSAEGKESAVGVTTRNLDDAIQRAMVAVDNDGKLVFRDEVLVRIENEVASDGINTDRDLALAVYAAVQELEKESTSNSCGVKTTVDAPTTDTPGLEAKNVIITCNAGSAAYRTILIRWVTNETLKSQLHVRVFKELWRQ